MLKTIAMGSNDNRPLGKYMSMALLLPISTAIGYGMGYGLDLLFNTLFLRWIFVVLGTISGFISLFRELADDEKNGGK